jgi:YggT family protein
VNLICRLLDVVIYTMLAWIILSYVAAYGRLPWGHPIRKFYDFLNRIMQPVLSPIRKVLPPLRIGGMALDLSPIVVFFGVAILRGLLNC